ncbi:ABC transporter substrate-binding protein [Devosia sp. 2618]|uniref:ABC transporter substrate-binding protein n=1 Tax=Devosia sp. 2618 TaxID=3156454 RepID=UPI0033965140
MLKALVTAALLLTTPVFGAEWSYTDGAGKSVTLDQPPVRIIAHSSVAAALIPYGIIPVGILRDGPPSLDRSLDGVDVSAIPVVSRGWFEIDAEAVLNLDPDIIITEYSPIEKTYQGGTGDDAIADRLETIAPTIGIERSNSIVDILERYRSLAATLGADTETAPLLAERARFDIAVARLEAATAARPGLTVMALSPGGSSISVGIPAYFGELNDFAHWGVDLVSPEATPGTSYFSLSAENIGTLKADVLLLDDRWEASPYDTLTNNPLSARLPAVAAGQMGDWPAEWIRSYGRYADQIDKLTDLIKRSRAALVD